MNYVTENWPMLVLCGGVILVLITLFKSPRTTAVITQIHGGNSTPPPDGRELCIACEAQLATEPMPELVEVRSVIDYQWLDDVCMRLGFRREVRYAVRVERSFGRKPLCVLCHRMARAVCEEEISMRATARAKFASSEAQIMNDFMGVKLCDILRERTSTVRTRIKLVQSQTLQNAPALPAEADTTTTS